MKSKFKKVIPAPTGKKLKTIKLDADNEHKALGCRVGDEFYVKDGKFSGYMKSEAFYAKYSFA